MSKTIHPLNVIPAEEFDRVSNKLADAWNEFLELQKKMEYHAGGSGGLMRDNIDDFRKTINDGHRIVIAMKHSEIRFPLSGGGREIRDCTNVDTKNP